MRERDFLCINTNSRRRRVMMIIVNVMILLLMFAWFFTEKKKKKSFRRTGERGSDGVVLCSPFLIPVVTHNDCFEYRSHQKKMQQEEKLHPHHHLRWLFHVLHIPSLSLRLMFSLGFREEELRKSKCSASLDITFDHSYRNLSVFFSPSPFIPLSFSIRIIFMDAQASLSSITSFSCSFLFFKRRTAKNLFLLFSWLRS